MEQDEEFKQAVSTLNKLESKILNEAALSKEQADMIKLVEVEIDKCIKALVARREALIHEITAKFQAKRDLMKSQQEQILIAIESCKKLLEAGTTVYPVAMGFAKDCWKLSAQAISAAPRSAPSIHLKFRWLGLAKYGAIIEYTEAEMALQIASRSITFEAPKEESSDEDQDHEANNEDEEREENVGGNNDEEQEEQDDGNEDEEREEEEGENEDEEQDEKHDGDEAEQKEIANSNEDEEQEEKLEEVNHSLHPIGSSVVKEEQAVKPPKETNISEETTTPQTQDSSSSAYSIAPATFNYTPERKPPSTPAIICFMPPTSLGRASGQAPTVVFGQTSTVSSPHSPRFTAASTPDSPIIGKAMPVFGSRAVSPSFSSVSGGQGFGPATTTSTSFSGKEYGESVFGQQQVPEKDTNSNDN